MAWKLCAFGALVLSLRGLAKAAPGEPGPAPRTAYAVPVEDNWEIGGALGRNVLILSLQGLANTRAPRLYVDYPASWHFHEFIPVKGFYERKYGVHFVQLKGIEDALAVFGSCAKGYVVWDHGARPSLNVAFTIAGLERAVVVDGALVPLAEKAGLRKIEDLRGRFEGKSDAEIYRWAYDLYGARCSRNFLIWMGGVAGSQMEPGVADLGIAKRCFFADLSANPAAKDEYALHKRILAGMHPGAFVFGWHSYPKDTEGQWVTLTSSYGLKVIGLNTLPNTTFNSQIGFSPDFRFQNNNHVRRGEVVHPQAKVYLCLVQSDSMGIGAWTEPDRGLLPYNWDVGVDGARWFPAVMEMYASTKTPNDYFNGGQSGYMYPVAIPRDRFAGLLREMNELMARYDEHVVSIMDHTLRGPPVGCFDLPKRIVDEFYENCPDAVGFINGYAAAHTYDVRNGQAFMSYDYYLDPQRSRADAIADLDELLKLNPRRPYFLLLHVRESNSIERVASIVQGVNEHPEVLPVDTFLSYAAAEPTFPPRYRNGSPESQMR